MSGLDKREKRKEKSDGLDKGEKRKGKSDSATLGSSTEERYPEM